jgi:hypothetical protein
MFWGPDKTRKYIVWAERTIVQGYTGGTFSDHWDLECYISVMKPVS